MKYLINIYNSRKWTRHNVEEGDLEDIGENNMSKKKKLGGNFMKSNNKQDGYLQAYFSYLKTHKFSVSYNDYDFFSTRKFPANNIPYHFNRSQKQKEFSLIEYRHKGIARTETFSSFMEYSGTNALLIIKDDAIVYEGYFNGHKRDTPHKLFSITKSFVSALIGIAISQGKIHSVDDLVKNYVPELNVKNVTIKQLLQMDAGIKYKEGYFPWKDEAKVYLYPNARKLALSVEEDTNDKFFHYNDYHLLVLGLIIERVIGGTVSEYLYDNILSPLGM